MTSREGFAHGYFNGFTVPIGQIEIIAINIIDELKT